MPEKLTQKIVGAALCLFHGGTEIVARPEFRDSGRFRDFGRAFYLTSSKYQAERWAKIQCGRRNVTRGVVNEYVCVDFERMPAMKVKRFSGANKEWLEAVIACRKGQDAFTGFDVVIGPVADDNVYQTIRLFELGTYTCEEALKRLLTERLYDQIALKSEAALAECKFVSHAEVEANV